MLWIIAARWLELPVAAGRTLRLDTATVSTFGWERESRVLPQCTEPCQLRSMDPIL